MGKYPENNRLQLYSREFITLKGLLWNLAQRDRFGKNTERKLLWEYVEIESIKDEKNNLKRVRPMAIVSQESASAKPKQLPPNLTEIENI